MSDRQEQASAVPARRTAITCPYCRSSDSEFYSLFGQQLLTVQYYCNTCHTPFEYIKDDDVLREGEAAFKATSSKQSRAI